MLSNKLMKCEKHILDRRNLEFIFIENMFCIPEIYKWIKLKEDVKFEDIEFRVTRI